MGCLSSDFHPHPSPKSQIRAFGIKTCVFALGHDRRVFLIWIPPCSLREAVVSESGVGHTPGRPGQGPGPPPLPCVLLHWGACLSSLCPIPSQRERESWGRSRHCQEAGAEPGAAPSVTAGGAGQCGLLDSSPLPSRGESNNLHIIISATRVLPLREEMLSFNRFLNKIDGFPLYFWKSAAFLKKID